MSRGRHWSPRPLSGLSPLCPVTYEVVLKSGHRQRITVRPGDPGLSSPERVWPDPNVPILPPAP